MDLGLVAVLVAVVGKVGMPMVLVVVMVNNNKSPPTPPTHISPGPHLLPLPFPKLSIAIRHHLFGVSSVSMGAMLTI